MPRTNKRVATILALIDSALDEYETHKAQERGKDSGNVHVPRRVSADI